MFKACNTNLSAPYNIKPTHQYVTLESLILFISSDKIKLHHYTLKYSYISLSILQYFEKFNSNREKSDYIYLVAGYSELFGLELDILPSASDPNIKIVDITPIICTNRH